MNPHLRRHLLGLVCLSLFIQGCSASAQGLFAPPAPQPALPMDQAGPWAHGRQHNPPWLDQPRFQAPSATHCARPVVTQEWPGRPQWDNQTRWPHGSARPADTRADARADAPTTPPAPPAPTPLMGRETASSAGVASSATAKDAAESVAADATRARSERKAMAGAASDHMPAPMAPQALAQPAPRVEPAYAPVTAGMVDDNADFSAYLSFRDRTRVQHYPRDVRERYLLQLRDGAGQGVADAEVVVQGSSGHASWARSDTAGRVWLHPDAFDPLRSGQYRVTARKNGAVANTQFTRGQKSAVDLRLDTGAAPTRARLDLVFLIDATGSMADEIDKLRATLKTIAAEVASLPSQPDLCLGLVAYRDQGDAFLWRRHDLTNRLDNFQDVLDRLQADGGGDYPEAMNEALNQTVHQISWRGNDTTRMVILLADAPPHLNRGGPRYDDDMLAALGKGIKIFSVGASGLNRQGEFIQRQLAQYTGGRFVFLTYADARRPSSGPGRETVHDVRNYSVDTLDRLIVKLVSDELGQLGQRVPGG